MVVKFEKYKEGRKIIYNSTRIFKIQFYTVLSIVIFTFDFKTYIIIILHYFIYHRQNFKWHNDFYEA